LNTPQLSSNSPQWDISKQSLSAAARPLLNDGERKNIGGG